jgi:uncharacterized membrane protein
MFATFLFTWFLCGAVCCVGVLWHERHERDIPYKIAFIMVVAGYLSVLITLAVFLHEKWENGEFRNPFYKEPKREE